MDVVADSINVVQVTYQSDTHSSVLQTTHNLSEFSGSFCAFSTHFPTTKYIHVVSLQRGAICDIRAGFWHVEHCLFAEQEILKIASPEGLSLPRGVLATDPEDKLQ